ncbi:MULTISPECIES: class I SAM-dependent methyltransferase [unclassified Streptomyces]|uniref:class I SAM-dependent methyltransferase n=1 Tax=unclassified Streptomyces TaxID=2593676 RepID=UPI00278BFD72|nr:MULTISPECIES: class I SAM-dependent methyltransferase [unclassified Streptomyces]
MAPSAQAVAERRPAYLTELAQGTERFHEPRRTDCPWCGAARLRTRLRTTDLFQGKPGTFVVDQCRSCGHSFQNPCLTPEGLDFYYRDFYDGLNGGSVESLFDVKSSGGRYRSSARALAAHLEPESWLDVGTSHGHFPAVAKEVLPYTAFDGLDMGESVEEGRRAGRIEEAHRGRLVDLAPGLEGRYDAMSMFHYLEHSLDPRQELKAAHRVLRPGGHLMIEVPDPESRFSSLLGKWWLPYFQPQHLHFITLGNLRTELRALGYTVVAVDRREPHQPVDLTAAYMMLASQLLPDEDAPWRTKAPTALKRGVRKAVMLASLPGAVACWLVDQLISPLVRRSRFSNAYRVIARRDPDA